MASPPKAVPAPSNSTETKEDQQQGQQDDNKQEEQSPSPPPPPTPPPPSPPPPSPHTPPPSPPPPSIQPPPSSPSEESKTPSQEDKHPAEGKTPSQEDKTPPAGKNPTPSSQTPPNKHQPPPALLPPPKSNSNTPELSPASKQDGKSSPEGDSGGSHKSQAKKDNQSNGNGAIIAGAAIGVVLFLILVCISASVCYCYKKKKKNRKPGFYSDGGGANGYYNNGGSAPPKQQAQGQHNNKNPRPPGMAVPVGGGWHGGPAALSGEMSSASYSGPHGPVLPPPSPNLAMGFNKSSFTYEELAAATGGFSQSNMIGQGGFGYVYKGTLPNGKDVAVKQLKAGSGQGEREFQAEVEIISRVHHRHLVSLVGYCIAGAQRILIYEFVPNKTLEYHLHRNCLPVMDWPTRLKIAIGSAKGLAYLHEDCHPRIIHRDIKTANILIDYKFEAMVADFGLAKLSSDTNTHVSTRVMGTFGYLAPEYASTGKLTDKSDVFSFGVMLLELITGRRPVDHAHRAEDSLVDWARPILGQILADENYGEVVDPRLEGNYNPVEMARMIACGAACVRHSARKRPRMSQIVRALEGDMISFEDLSEGVKPRQSSQSSSGTETESSTYSSEMRQFQRVAMASGEYTGEYCGATGEYGLHPSDSGAPSTGATRFGAGRKARGDV